MSIEELGAYGIREMDDEQIRRFLSNQRVGVLGLPEEDEPYLLPLSFGYDGDERLYFTYLVGSDSRKTVSSEMAERASFLVFKVDTMYNWQSVLLSGTITAVPESEWDELTDLLESVWRPDVLGSAHLSGGLAVYEFRIDDRRGITHQGLPPELEKRIE
ncbi:pyridoxamine 5'-phosphate oxidase family protein [Natrialbaceae archaeon GCM10025810]|uniref:pyridoxamine 5'-phosphate oxidase family protein n=1 Tax=Halovalidus salilacus TaxID=3075124 RepID=UPI00360FD2A0